MGTNRERVALVYAPWGSIARPSIAAGILKRCAARTGVLADVYYPNIWFAERIGLELYENISAASAFYPEWFFASRLAAAEPSVRVANSWDDLEETESGRAMRSRLIEMCGGSAEKCLEIAGNVPGFLADCLDRVDWLEYGMAGFSVTFAQTFASLLLAREIKLRNPAIKIVAGGASIDSEMGFELLKAYEWIDYAVHGEGEKSFAQLLEQVFKTGSEAHIPGVSFRRGSMLQPGYDSTEPLRDLNESPAPDYSDYFREAKRCGIDHRLEVTLPFESSRGCWWGAKQHCTFCGLNGNTMQFRKKSADRVFEEIEGLSSEYRLLNMAAVDNILDMGYFRELLPRLAEADRDYTLFYEVKANLTKEQVRLMAASGITQIQPGIESLNNELLRMMRKGVTVAQNIQLLRWCSEFGIEPLWNILYGFPGEDRSFYEQYPRLMRRLFHLQPPAGISPVIFERFSPYHFERERFGLQLAPLREYALLYPEKVDLERIAYYFSGTWKDQQEPPSNYIGPVLETYKEWTRVWESGRANFYYERGPGYLVLHDSRPLSGGIKCKPRRTVLNQIQAAIYLFCDEARSFQAIAKEVSQTFPVAPSEQQLRTLLQQFTEQGFMWSEGERYVSLAVRKRPARAYTLGRAKVSRGQTSVPELAHRPSPAHAGLAVLNA